jgi:hypothetical protein
VFVFLVRDTEPEHIGISEEVEAVGYGLDIVVSDRDNKKVDYLVKRVATHHSIPYLRPAECVYEPRDIGSAFCYRLGVSPSDESYRHSAGRINQLLRHIAARGVADEFSPSLAQPCQLGHPGR